MVSASSYPQFTAPVPKSREVKSRNGSPRKSDHTTVDHLVGLSAPKFSTPIQPQLPMYQNVEK